MLAFHRRALAFSFAPLLLLTFATAGPAQTSTSISSDDANDGEQQLEFALTQRGSIDFTDTPLKDVVEALSRQFQVQMLVSTKSLGDAGKNVDAPVTKQLQNLPLESILRLVLEDFDLGFTVRDNVIVITSHEDLEGRLKTRIYPVLDLVAQRGSRNTPAAAEANYDSLIDAITTTINPQSWDEVGGPGSVTALDNAGALIISQTRDIHHEIENLLIALRRVKTTQGIPSAPIKFLSPRVSSRPISGAVGHATTAPAWQLPQVYPAVK